jgi:hypothetical protein
MLDECERKERFVCRMLKELSKKEGKLSHDGDLSRPRLLVWRFLEEVDRSKNVDLKF